MIGIYLLVIAMEILGNAIIFHSFLGYPFRKGWLKYVVLLTAFLSFGSLSLVPGLQALLLSAISIFLSFLVTLFLYDKEVKSLIITYLPISLVKVAWDNLFTEIIQSMYPFREDVVSDLFLRQCISQGILILLLIGLYVILKRKNRLTMLYIRQIPKPIYLLSISGISLTSFIMPMIRVTTENASRKEAVVSYIAFILLPILIQVICLALLILFYSREHYKTINRIRESFNEKQIEYYEALLAREEDTRKFRHDIKNHIICIQELLDSGKTEEAAEYTRELYQDMEGIAGIYDTGNDIINVILNYYTVKGREDNIVIQVTGHIGAEISIPLIHLSTVVSNILSNAYEAANKLDRDTGKIIQVEIRSGSKFLELSVTNPALAGRPRLDENTPTSKYDRKNHGFGIRSIREIVAQYDGKLNIIDNTDSVTVRVVLKIA